MSPDAPQLSRDESFFVTVLRWIKGYGTPVAGAGSALLIGLSTHPAFTSWAWIVPVGIGLGLAAVVGVFAVHPSYPKLTEQRDAAVREASTAQEAMRGALRVILKRLMREIELTNTHYRVSMYCHSDASFLMLARHSGHARHAQPGRVRYREAEDVITAAWSEGWSVFIDLPAKKEKRVEELVRRQGMSFEDANNLSMPSRSVVGYRLIHDGDPVGVIVLESTQPRGVSHDTKTLLDSSQVVPMCSAILASTPDRLESIVPIPPKKSLWSRISCRVRARKSPRVAAPKSA